MIRLSLLCQCLLAALLLTCLGSLLHGSGLIGPMLHGNQPLPALQLQLLLQLRLPRLQIGRAHV